MGLFGNIVGGFLSSLGGSDVEWYCDDCNAKLNDQPGFTTDYPTWECAECGHDNDVTSTNLYDSHEHYQEVMGIPRCPACGNMVQGDAPDATYWFNCTGCPERFYLENGELISPFDKSRRSTGRTCERCQRELRGYFTAPWEDGGNRYGYVECASCGRKNITEMG